MGLAEDAAKVCRIVAGSDIELTDLYSDAFLEREFADVQLVRHAPTGMLRRCTSHSSMTCVLAMLPVVRSTCSSECGSAETPFSSS